MPTQHIERMRLARRLMDDFATRTGLTGKAGNTGQRYLWTDALAVQTFFSLSHTLSNNDYHALALKLVDEVHQHLGRFHPKDTRTGWISGLPESEGREHPTAGGLRIGKQLPERSPGEPFSEPLEWQRDGQYFHYLARWVQALLDAERETKEKHYTLWAAELMQASEKFIYKAAGRTRMYWKMSTDLSWPLVSSQGAHDPLDGLVCALGVQERLPGEAALLRPLVQDLEDCSRGMHWYTADPLGLGGLLLNLAHVVQLESKGIALPEAIQPNKLLRDSLEGLESYSRLRPHHPGAEYRLAFRDCGLSLGLRVVTAKKDSKAAGTDLRELDQFIPLAGEIEAFWSNPQNQHSSTWSEHLDINAVTLAASLMAAEYPSSNVNE